MGMRPIVEIMWGDFMLVALDQIINQAANVRYITAASRVLPSLSAPTGRNTRFVRPALPMPGGVSRPYPRPENCPPGNAARCLQSIARGHSIS